MWRITGPCSRMHLTLNIAIFPCRYLALLRSSTKNSQKENYSLYFFMTKRISFLRNLRLMLQKKIFNTILHTRTMVYDMPENFYSIQN